MNPSKMLRVDLAPVQILLSFALAFGLAFLWATVYRKTHSGVAYTRSFYLCLVMIAPSIAMIMMAIGSNVALSLGLVGSLSIVRFRAVIKDAKDLTFLLVAIAIGLCCGASVWMIGVVGTIVLSAIAILMSKIGHSKASSADYILIFRSNEKDPWDQLPSDARKLISWRQLRSATDVDSGSEFEYTYSVRLAPKASPERIIGELANGVARQVTVIAPENHLAL